VLKAAGGVFVWAAAGLSGSVEREELVHEHLAHLVSFRSLVVQTGRPGSTHRSPGSVRGTQPICCASSTMKKRARRRYLADFDSGSRRRDHRESAFARAATCGT
jgi:hypothetical protein